MDPETIASRNASRQRLKQFIDTATDDQLAQTGIRYDRGKHRNAHLDHIERSLGQS